jgi:hypothetical protein
MSEFGSHFLILDYLTGLLRIGSLDANEEAGKRKELTNCRNLYRISGQLFRRFQNIWYNLNQFTK